MGDKFVYVGNGVYTLSDAHRVTKIDRLTLYRWVHGRVYRRGDEKRFVDPVVRNLYDVSNDHIVIDFVTLMELRFVDAFRERGVPIRSIRLAVAKARKTWGVRNPLVARRFMTDGRKIFADALDETGEQHVVDMVNDQFQFSRLVREFLEVGIEYDTDEAPAKWWPMGRDRSVVLDPKRSFGAPIVAKEGVPTAALYSARLGGQSTKQVAQWYGVDIKSVEDAIKYESSLAA